MPLTFCCRNVTWADSPVSLGSKWTCNNGVEWGEGHRDQLFGSTLLWFTLRLGAPGWALISLTKTPRLCFYLLRHPGAMDKAPCPGSLRKCLNLAEPQFIPLVGVNNACLSESLWELSELSMLCVLAQCLLLRNVKLGPPKTKFMINLSKTFCPLLFPSLVPLRTEEY